MSRQSWTKLSAVCLLAALLGAFLAVSDAAAGNKKSNPSPQGQANGVAHRVAYLEGEVADQADDIAELQTAVSGLMLAVGDLQLDVAALEARVAALESPTTVP